MHILCNDEKQMGLKISFCVKFKDAQQSQWYTPAIGKLNTIKNASFFSFSSRRNEIK